MNKKRKNLKKCHQKNKTRKIISLAAPQSTTVPSKEKKKPPNVKGVSHLLAFLVWVTTMDKGQ